MTTLTKNELLGLTALVAENRDSAKLQKISDIGYIDSINLKAKLLGMISDIEKSEWAEKQKGIYDISYDYNTQEMVIKDNRNDVEYRIHRDLVDNDLVEQYNIVNAESEADELERIMIPEARSESDRELMREDLETLRECEDEFAIGYYGTNGFVTKESNIEEFNKICLEIIESYHELCYSVTVSNIKWDFEDENYEDYDGPANEIVKHYWILPSTLEAKTLEEAKEEIEELISDKLSDEEGFCHNGFDIKIIEPYDKSLADYINNSLVDLNDLTKEQLLEIVENLEHYPSITEDDDRDYILAYFNDESCSISKEEIEEFIKNNYECRCNNCMSYFKSDDDLEDCNDEGELIKGCPKCKTDSYLMDLKN